MAELEATETISDAAKHAAHLRYRLGVITGKIRAPDSRRSLPAVTIGNRPNASRTRINRTAKKKLSFNPESAQGKIIPIGYGVDCQPIRVFAIGKNGNNLVIGGWFALGEIEEITKVYINDVDASTINGVTVTNYTGTTSQTADATLAAAISGYTDTLVLTVSGTNIGVAYIVVEIEPGALESAPRIMVKYKGRKDIEDTRTPATEYSDNPALCFRNWLKSAVYGPGFSVDDTAFEDLADHCDTVLANDWQASHNYSVGDFCKPTGANTKNRMYEVTTDAGSSGGTEPAAWDDTLGNTTADGGITWTCRDGRRHVCGMAMEQSSDLTSWIETWRTACGALMHYSEDGLSGVPDAVRATDHTFTHTAGNFPESPGITWSHESLANTPTVVRVVYTDTSAIPWRDGTDARIAKSGVDAGTVRLRESIIYARWIHRKSEAVRLATKRLNSYTLTNLRIAFPLFDEGLEVCAGDVVEITHPVGFTLKKLRVLNNPVQAAGRWFVDGYEYDSAVYSSHLETEPTSSDFGLNIGTAIPRVYTSTPTTPYKVGDLWVGGPSGDIKRCSTARISGAYQAGDWELASDYTEGATWGSNITSQPADALLLNELNCVGGYQEVSLPKEDGSLNCVDCYINNNSGTAYWFKVAEFDLAGNYKTCTFNGLFNYGGSSGRYTSQMRVRISASTDGASTLINLGYQYSGDDKTANLKVAYSGVVVTVYAYLSVYCSCLFDGAWSANVVAGNSWIHTLQDNTDNIGTGTPSGTYLTPAKNYTLGADVTNDNTADDADHYTGASIATTYTAADITGDNTADDTDHMNGAENTSGVCAISSELRINGTTMNFYSSGSYRGKIYCNETYMYLDSPSFIMADTLLPANSTDDLGSAWFHWDNLYVDDIYADSIAITRAAVTLGSLSTPFTLHIYDTGSSSWVTYDAYTT